ncbi:hypothetical protein [Bradyrhizobium sp. 197]|uniref:hypothetical protein n=1 Tax=Bradyrhizobium sp. 197 TaxID=2782663 RepID=UPI001FF80915|nr:hypothetical protein [Bradyrhizobium sp. 197]
MVEELDHRSRAVYAHMGGGELDGERDAVEPAAKVADIRGIRIRQRELAASRSRALDEEFHGSIGEGVRGRQNGPLRRARQRRETVCEFAFDAQQLPARGQDVQLRRCLVEPLGKRRRCLDDGLAAIQNEQHAPVAQECREVARGIIRSDQQSK